MPENINFSDRRVLRQFISDMIDRKTPEGLDDAQKDKLMTVLFDQLNEWVEHALIAALPEDRLTALNTLLDQNGSDADIDRIFDESGVDFDKVTQQALVDFKNNYLQNGDNATLLQKADADYAKFLAETPAGQGSPFDDVTIEQQPVMPIAPVMAEGSM